MVSLWTELTGYCQEVTIFSEVKKKSKHLNLDIEKYLSLIEKKPLWPGGH